MAGRTNDRELLALARTNKTPALQATYYSKFTQFGSYYITGEEWGKKKRPKYKGGWWHIDCYYSNLNGVYRHGEHSATTFGIRWNSWKEKPQSMKRAEMKIRPVNV